MKNQNVADGARANAFNTDAHIQARQEQSRPLGELIKDMIF